MEDIKRNWTEDLNHENGHYMCICSVCKEQFQGHKRRVVCKLCATHPSDSDIEKEAKEFTEQHHAKTDMKGAYTYSGYIAGAKWMHDRMNGEMCAFAEWIANNYVNFNIVPDGIYMDMKDLLKHKSEATPYTTEQLLQKFRNRDL